MLRGNKKGKGAVIRANPDFGRAGIKVQGALFVDFGKRTGRRKNLHTDLRSAGEDLRIFGDLWAIGSKPSHVDSLDAISGRHRALRQGSTTRQKIIQKMDNVTLATRVSESWRRAHKDVAMTIGLNPIRELRKGWIRQDFGPTLQVELGLRNALRHLKGDSHGRRYARKRKNEIQDRRAAAGTSKVSAAGYLVPRRPGCLYAILYYLKGPQSSRLQKSYRSPETALNKGASTIDDDHGSGAEAFAHEI